MSARAWLAFVALGVFWGLPYLFIKIAIQEILLGSWLSTRRSPAAAEVAAAGAA